MAYVEIVENSVVYRIEGDYPHGSYTKVIKTTPPAPTQEKLKASKFDPVRDMVFAMAEWVRQRHADNLELSIDDSANWLAWLNFWKALRDLPETEKFDPEKVVWPDPPETIKNYPPHVHF